MSLNALIRDNAELRQGFGKRLLRPQVKLEQGLQVPPQTANLQTVGNAFDYLLRFHLQRLNPNARDTVWAAERGVELIGLGPAAVKGSDVPTISRHPKRLKAAGYLADAKRQHKAFLQNGQVTDNLVAAVYRLAHLDVAYRSGPDRVNWHGIGYLDPGDATDLKALLQRVDDNLFRASRACLLHPALAAADLVGGAEPDMILDDCLIDVRTAKEARIDVRDFYQLVGYYLLLGLGGVSRPDRPPEQCPVTAIGIYLARFGQLWKVPVKTVIPAGSIADLTRWFVDTACASNKDGSEVLRACTGPLAGYVQPQAH